MTHIPSVLYLAPDLGDTAIARRAEILRRGATTVSMAGFRRTDSGMAGPAVVLGQTRNSAMLQRIWSVMKALPWLSWRLGLTQAPDIILARNLEMLVLGVWLNFRYRKATLVYEVLDIHRLMLGSGIISRVLRWIEALLMRRTGMIIISSPGFERNYLAPYRRPIANLVVFENKVVPQAVKAVGQTMPGSGVHGPVVPGKITIGWFGILRCGWSLSALDTLTRAAPGRYAVVLRGKPAYDVMPEFDAVVDANPDIAFLGPYRWPEDLLTIYAAVDFTWLIDRYDAGTNSDWLLPNRLYEGSLHCAIPLYLAGTETAARLGTLGIGLAVSQPDPSSVRHVLDKVHASTIERLRQAVAAVPSGVWQVDNEECLSLVARMLACRSHPKGSHFNSYSPPDNIE